MKLKVDGLEFHLLVDKASLGSQKVPIVFLHGFTGCAEDWQFMFDKLPNNFYPIAIDLVGHGKSFSPENELCYSAESIVFQLNSIFKQLDLDKIILLGYSMGGRAAISYCMRHPSQIKAAIFESATAGIEDITQKKERIEYDLLLADKILKDGVESFMDYWFNTTIFESLKEISDFDQIKNRRNQNSAIGLSNMLSAFSTGLMPSYWDKLHILKFPVLLISGELDEKYCTLNKKMNDLIKHSKHKIAERCRHNVHLEKPELFSNFVIEFLKSLN